MSGRREKKGYALKVERGLVPHRYERNARFNQGAWKNWPANVDERERYEIASRETASARFIR